MKNQKGSVLIWIAAAGLMVAVIVASLASLTVSYHRRTIQKISADQAYLTARSTAELIASEIRNQSYTGRKIYTSALSGECKIDDFSYDADMGETEVTVTAPDRLTVKVTATATVDTQIKTVTVYLQGAESEDSLSKYFPALTAPNGFTWPMWETPEVYTMYGLPFVDNGVIGVDSDADSFYYVDKFSPFNKENAKKVTLKAQGSGNIYIFVLSGATFNIRDIEHSSDMENVTIEGQPYDVAPNVYIILEENAQLQVGDANNATDCYMYIYSPYGSSNVLMGHNNAHCEIDFYGSVMAKNLLIYNDKKPEDEAEFYEDAVYIKPAKDKYESPDGSGAGSEIRWGVAKYED